MSARPFNICEVCKEPKTKWKSHAKCSRIMQERYEAKHAVKSAISRGRRRLSWGDVANLIKNVRSID